MKQAVDCISETFQNSKAAERLVEKDPKPRGTGQEAKHPSKEILDREGFRGQYDFLYLPMKFISKSLWPGGTDVLAMAS